MVFRIVPSILGKRCLRELYPTTSRTPLLCTTLSHPPSSRPRTFSTTATRWERKDSTASPAASEAEAKTGQQSGLSGSPSDTSEADSGSSRLEDWENEPNLRISKFSELPTRNFGVNQHILINEEFKEALRQILWQFRAPIRYAFAYGSGVFPQSAKSSTENAPVHPNPPEAIAKVQGGKQKMIDFIFGVSFSQHWHSLNLQEHRNHYSAVGSLGSYAVAKLQDNFGSGMYFNPYVEVNGVLVKYGVVNIDTLCKDLSEWNTLYLAGRLQKPVKILRDNPSVRLANQVNLMSAIRTALLLLPEKFTERQLYATIAGISYMGDPRMSVGGDDPRKVENIVQYQLSNFRRLYSPLIENLPNIEFNDPVTSSQDWVNDDSANAKLTQNMDPVTRGHMVRRLPQAFRQKLYFEYQAKFKIPRGEFNAMMEKTRDEDPDRIRRREGGPFEQRIAKDVEGGGLREEVKQVIEKTVRWPSFTQSVKSVITAGVRRSWRYAREKRQKGKAQAQTQASSPDSASQSGESKKSE